MPETLTTLLSWALAVVVMGTALRLIVRSLRGSRAGEGLATPTAADPRCPGGDLFAELYEASLRDLEGDMRAALERGDVAEHDQIEALVRDLRAGVPGALL